MKEMLFEDYESLENVIIDWIWFDENEKEYKLEVKVDGCEYDVGLTLKATDNPKNNFKGVVDYGIDCRNTEMTCLHGKSSPIKYSNNYDEKMKKSVEMIIEGKYYPIEIDKIDGVRHFSGQGNLNCAFK